MADVIVEEEAEAELRFPYGLVFLEKDGAIHVIAAAHARQDKNYWLRRVGSNK